MNLFHESKKILDKDGKVNPLGPYGKGKLTGQEISSYFKQNKLTGLNKKLKRAIEVALDLGGAMSVASKEIAKFYGNSVLKHKEVQNALKFANEQYEVQQEDAKAVAKMFRDRDWQKLIKKHKRHIDAFTTTTGRQKDLPSKVEDDLITWALDNGEISHKGEVEDFIDDVLNAGDWKEGNTLVEKNLIPDLQNIVQRKQHAKVGGITVDMFTASMITQIYDKVNDANKKKMEKSNISTLVDLAQRIMRKNEKDPVSKIRKNKKDLLKSNKHAMDREPLKGYPYNEVKEDLDDILNEKIEYVEYKFRNKRDAQKALDYFKKQNLIKFKINDDNLNGGELTVDAGKKDMTKYHNEVMKKFKAKVVDWDYTTVKEDWTTQLKEHLLTEGMSKEMPLDVYADKIGIDAKEKKWIMDNEKEGEMYYNNSAFPNYYFALSYPIYDKDYYFAFIGDSKRVNAKANAEMNRELRKLKGMKATPEQKSKGFNDVHALYAKMYEYFGRLQNLGAHDTMTREELSYAVTHIKTGKATNELAFNYELAKEVDNGTFFEQILDREQKPLPEGKHGKMLRGLQMKALRRKTRIKGKAGAFEAVSPAQQAAIAISKKEKGEKPKNESVHDAYRQMWEDGQKYAPELKEAKEFSQKDIDIVAKFTDRNEHTLSLMHVAKVLGDRKAGKKLELIYKMHNEYGHMPSGLKSLRDEIFDDFKKQFKKYGNGDQMYGAL